MTRVVFSGSDATRIAKTVKYVERLPRTEGKDTAQRPGVGPNTFLARATANIAYNASADVSCLSGTVGSESVGSNPLVLNAHNVLYQTIWSGANVLLTWPIVDGSGGKWRITWTDAATRVRGTSAGSISAGASGTISGLVVINGRVGPGTSIVATNVLANLAIPSGVAVWAEWTQANNRWEIYNADCEAA